MIFFQVHPRYTAGKPRRVDEAQALRIAAQERAAYLKALSGAQGPENRSKAILCGLGGIVEMRGEVKGGHEVVDLIEGKRFFRAYDRRPLSNLGGRRIW